VDTVSKMQPDEYKRLAEGITSGDPNNPAVQQGIKTLAEQTETDPQTAASIFDNMDDGAKIMLGLGLALGTVSLISGLASEDGGAMGFLGSVLGFGAAAGVLAHHGMFGPQAQQFTQSLMQTMGFGEAQKGVSPEQAAQQDEAAIAALMNAGQGQPEQGQPPAAPTEVQKPAEPQPGQPSAEQPQPQMPQPPKAQPHQQEFLGFMADKQITPDEFAQIQKDPKFQEYLFNLPDNAGVAALRALAKGDPEMAEKLKSMKTHGGTYGDPIAAAIAQPAGKKSLVGPYGFRQEVPGMGLTPEQAKRLVALAGKM